mmetsp:Transcript_102564/g.289707  ORF Transcript_102564/g.289707 Transcript_102564/m.289707 type:complete len:1527 (-) Transcript_102564:124-4704(-)
MWVWQSLGYDQVSELPLATLDVLGRRCRHAGSYAEALDPPTAKRAVDGDGDLLIISSSPGPPASRISSPGTTGGGQFGSRGAPNDTGATESSWRLQFIDLPGTPTSPKDTSSIRVLVPGTLHMKQAPAPIVSDFGGMGEAFESLAVALETLVERGGGSCVYKVPMVEARLREDIAAECCEFVAPSAWPLVAHSVVLGADFRIVVEVPDASGTIAPPSPTRRTNISGSRCTLRSTHNSPGGISFATTGVAGEKQLQHPVVVEGKGFQLQLYQQGGPQIDPSKLHTKTQAEMAEAIEKWAVKKLPLKPGYWRTLYVNAKEGATEGKPLASPLYMTRTLTSICGEGILDTVLAANAVTEIAFEPFELSYGDAHLHSMKRMFEDEVADVLSIAPEQVLCGEFLHRWQGVGRRHLKQTTVCLQFSVLHTEMVEVRMRQEAKQPYPKMQFPGKLATMRGHQAEDLTATIKETLPSPALMSKGKKGSTSLPDLKRSASVLSDQSVRGLAVTPPLGDDDSVNSELQPDLLLRKLMAAMSERRHPLRRHTDVFPMLSRVPRGGITAGATLVAHRELITPGTIAEALREFMRVQKPRKRELQVDRETLRHLSEKRHDILLQETGADGEHLARLREFRVLSPKELLDKVAASLAIPADLAACLEVLVQMTETDQDASGNTDQCIKLKHHHIMERLNFLMRRFKTQRTIMFSCITIVANLTRHDIGCVDRILEKHLAPDLLALLGNFPKDHPIQLCGSAVLRRLFGRARETSTSGPRVITLGKGVDEVWTFRGVDRILTSMSLFEEDECVQYDACVMLASLAELLHNNGKAVATYQRVSTAMSKHAHRADIMKLGVVIIARLGPSFLAHEHRGIRTIVDAMERHRSDVELQRAGARAFFALAKTEMALRVCRKSGAISAMLLAMFAHSSDSQVLQESTRALEKHCPIALMKVIDVCGDLAATLSPVYWRSDPLDFSGKSFFDIGGMKADGWSQEVIDSLLTDVLTPKARKSGSIGLANNSGNEESADVPVEVPSSLDTCEGYRRMGLREELDALDGLWALPGPPLTGLTLNEADHVGQHLQRDIENLQSNPHTSLYTGPCEPVVIHDEGGDVSGLLVPGPTDEQLKKLCEALQSGASATSKWGPHDGELLVLLLGHYSWHSRKYAKMICEFGAPRAVLDWLKGTFLAANADATKVAERWALQRACLGAIGSFCKHAVSAEKVMEVEGAIEVIGFSKHLDLSIQRNAMRCIARMIPYTLKVTLESNRLNVPDVWELILRELRATDGTVRTCAAACALEAVAGGWAKEDAPDPPPIEDLAKAFIDVLLEITPPVDVLPTPLQSTTALPVLMTAATLVAEEEAAAQALFNNGQLTRLLMRWLPAGAPEKATSVDRAVATAAAKTLEALSSRGATLSPDDMEALLRYGSSDSASPGLRAACQGALELAVQSEVNVEHLGQLFATRIPRPGGSHKLAIPAVLQCIIDRIVHLLKGETYRDCGPQDRLVRALDSAIELLPKSDEPTVLESLVNEARAIGMEEPR